VVVDRLRFELIGTLVQACAVVRHGNPAIAAAFELRRRVRGRRRMLYARDQIRFRRRDKLSRHKFLKTSADSDACTRLERCPPPPSRAL